MTGDADAPPYRRMEVIGNCTLFLGNSRDILPVLEPADCLISDPDYGVGMKYGDQCLEAAEADELVRFALNGARVRSDHGCIFWSGSWLRILGLNDAIAQTDWRIHHLGVWYKPNGSGPSGNGLARRFETWFWIRRGETGRRAEFRFLPDCIAENRLHRGMSEASPHPSQKPVDLMIPIVKFFSLPGHAVLDPFMGSGSTGVACVKSGRSFIGIELFSDYFEIACERIRQVYAQREMFSYLPSDHPVQQSLL